MKILILILCLLFPLQILSKTFGIAEKRQHLEQVIRKDHSVQNLLKLLSDPSAAKSPSVPDNLKLYLALHFMDERNNEVAKTILMNIDSKNIEPTLLTFTRVKLDFESGDFSSNKIEFAEFLKKFPNDPEVLILSAMEQTSREDYINAKSSLDLAIKHAPKHGRAYFQRAIVMTLSLSYDQAYKDFTSALKILPKNEITLRQYSELQSGLIQLKFFMNSKKAKQHIERGLKMDPESRLAAELRATLATL